MTLIAVLGNKGGTGKTFIAVHLAWALAEKGKKIFFLDADYAQGSALKWLVSQQKKFEYDILVKVPNNELQIDVVWLDFRKHTSESLSEMVIKTEQEKYDFLIIDGRPEPRITNLTLKTISISKHRENIIIFPCVGWDSITQTKEIVRFVNEQNITVRMYGWLNQSDQARTSARIAQYFATLTITPFGIALPNSITVKMSEMSSKPVWKVKGCGRTKFGVFFDSVSTSLVMKRL